MATEMQLLGLEQSLIQFLSRRPDIEEKISGGMSRVNLLKIKIDDRNLKHLTFSVQVGMMEAKFSLENGLKEQGSCYGIDKYIRDWYTQPSVKVEFEEIIFGKNHIPEK